MNLSFLSFLFPMFMGFDAFVTIVLRNKDGKMRMRRERKKEGKKKVLRKEGPLSNM